LPEHRVEDREVEAISVLLLGKDARPVGAHHVELRGWTAHAGAPIVVGDDVGGDQLPQVSIVGAEIDLATIDLEVVALARVAVREAGGHLRDAERHRG
jgi:hypothetical protein